MTDIKIFINDLKISTVQVADDDTGEENTNESGCFCFFDVPIFKLLHEFLTVSKADTFESLHAFIENYSKLCDNPEKQLQMIAGGVGFLNIFIQKNWLGPDAPLDAKIIQMSKFETRKNVLKELVVDGENVISAVQVPELLLLSKIILETAWSNFMDSHVSKIWYLRCLFIHQQILEELSPKLFEKINTIIEKIDKELNNMPRNVAACCHLEFARIFIYYQNVQKSKVEMESATELSGIEITLTGALGKRTKFQKENLAQLILKINLKSEENFKEPCANIFYSNEPKDIKLEDDVRLDKIEYVDAAHHNYPDLSGLQQAVLLGNIFQTQKSQPKDSLADEELQPLINCILEQPKIWSIRMTTLLLRSKLEASHKRTVERAMMQVQVLTDSFKASKVSFKERFTYFFISHLSPLWEIHSVLANILVSMGSIKSALEIYLKLEEWENVIYCYNALQLRHKAEEVIEQELKKQPSPKLWCLLGDTTGDVSCFEKAWDLSNKRSARAQRHWAYFYYYRKNYAECIEHFQKSLEINSLQKELWSCLGFAALMEERWELSAQAYRRYCTLDSECFEAWNNLGRCYCELKQKYRAWRALQEALKVDRSNWKVWDNYMLVSSDLQAFDEVIKSYHEILNLRERHVDIPVLNSLVVGFKNFDEETKKVKIDKNIFKNKLLELFGRLTSQVINDEELWFLYSEIVDVDTAKNMTKKHQLLMKAHRSAVNKPNWEKKLENCNRIIYVLSKMVEVGLKMQNSDVLMSCKVAGTGALAKIKKLYPDARICEELEENLEKIDKILNC